MQLKMSTVDPAQLRGEEVEVPDTSGMSNAEREAVVNQLLAKALERSIDFEPNAYAVPASAIGTLQAVIHVLKAFPSMPIRCEGHAKGQPADNNLARQKLSQLRAEAVKAALREAGVENLMDCHGCGSQQGLGMCVKMVVADAETVKRLQVQVPDTEGLNEEEQKVVFNEAVAKVLDARKISFEPNSAEIQSSCVDTIAHLFQILKAFPNFALNCEGHAKGQPSDNNPAKMRLSGLRAESVSRALKQKGAINEFACVGHGSAMSAGICVRLFAPELLIAHLFFFPPRSRESGLRATILGLLLGLE